MTGTSRVLRILFSTVIAIFSLSACSFDLRDVSLPLPATSPTLVQIPADTPEAMATSTVKPSATIPAKIPAGGSITLGFVGEPSFEITTLPRFLLDSIYDSLVEFDAQDGSPGAGLAEAWKISDDARTIEFRLRANVQWHDGRAFTAGDVVFTFTTLSNPKSRLTPTTDFGPLDKITALDERNVRVTFKSPYCPALAYLGAVKILPRHILEKGNLAQLTPQQLIGTGALKLVEYREKDTFMLKRNVNYWQGAPHIENWTLKIFPQAGAQGEAFAKGALDLDEFDSARGDNPPDAKGARVQERASNSFYVMAISNTLPVLNDARVRRALGAAINRNTLLQDAVNGHGQAIEFSLLPSFWAFPGVANERVEGDKLFADAGWTRRSDGTLIKNGGPFEVSLLAIADDPVAEAIAYRVREMLDAVGVKTQLKLSERNFYLTRLFDHTFDLAVVRWNVTSDPDQSYLWHSKQSEPGVGFNVVSYANPRVDQLLEQALAVTSCDGNARKSLYGQAYKQIALDAPYAFLFAPERGLVARERVGGLAPSSFAGDYWNLSDWFVIDGR